jgi:bifunctional non-homologous end joining protein LigD
MDVVMAARADRQGCSEGALPGFIEPALASLQSEPPAGPGWVHEIKFDGYRLQTHICSGEVTLLTRRGLDWTYRFGRTLPAAFLSLPVKTAIIDGEVVVEGAGGVPSFPALQDALATGGAMSITLSICSTTRAGICASCR